MLDILSFPNASPVGTVGWIDVMLKLYVLTEDQLQSHGVTTAVSAGNRLFLLKGHPFAICAGVGLFGRGTVLTFGNYTTGVGR